MPGPAQVDVPAPKGQAAGSKVGSGVELGWDPVPGPALLDELPPKAAPEVLEGTLEVKSAVNRGLGVVLGWVLGLEAGVGPLGFLLRDLARLAGLLLVLPEVEPAPPESPEGDLPGVAAPKVELLGAAPPNGEVPGAAPPKGELPG